MGKTTLIIKATLVFIISVVYAALAAYFIFHFLNKTLKLTFSGYFLYSLALASATVLQVFLNDMIIRIYTRRMGYLYVLAGSIFYWFLTLHTYYEIFLTPLVFFVIAWETNFFIFNEDRTTVPHILTFLTVVLVFSLLMIFYSNLEYLMPYKFISNNETFLFVCLMLSYLGVYHFFHVLFNLKNIAARMPYKK
jgi:hypothetical protein